MDVGRHTDGRCPSFQLTFAALLMYVSRLTDALPIVVAYVSAIQAISRSPVPISGAGTSTPGPADHT